MGLTPSFRFPAKLPADTAHPKVIDAIEQNTNGLVDVNQAIVFLSNRVRAITTPTTGTTTTSAGSTTVIESGVSSFNAETGGVVYFPSMGLVNNQSGVTAYTTQTQDNGALIVLASASAIAVTLNFTVAAPWYTTISNQGAGTVTVTPSNGLINAAASITIPAGNFATIFFDGANWWSDSPSGGISSGVSQIIAGTNVTISPVGGTGAVTVNATGGGGGYLKGTVTINLTATSGTFYGTATITGANTGMGATVYCPQLGILSPTGPVAFIQGNMTACINSANTVTCAVTISGFASPPGNVTFPVVVFP
jgi:hypothetical protein